MKITLISFNLNEEGLTIVYYKGSRLEYFISNPEQAAHILKERDFISDYTGSGDLVAVEWETSLDYADHDGEHIQDVRLHQAEWEAFVHQFYLEKFDILDIISYHEKKKEEERHRRASSVDMIVDRILRNPA